MSDSNANDCFICHKHQNLDQYCGEFIAERGGLVLTHFPKLETEPTTKGHLIIETKRHIVDLTELSDEEAQALGTLARDGAKAIKSLVGAEHVYMFRINDKVAHLHVHLIPRYPGTPHKFWGVKIWEWPGHKIDLIDIKETARELKIKLSQAIGYS